MTTAADPLYSASSEITLPSDHLDAPEATIARSEECVVLVNFEADCMTMTNHKWVVESEIQPAS